ncbi:lipoprotein N-acyltransferase Lnb domain-containing protein [Pseudoxanthomonas kaohsiungensis]|uniref:lipoprotein N-acyltransferase Lnb domain-containing protein n=1 Tax=Pseudoxanthomonas kaohsiungensis TaxID=283923 RepID=UPI0035B2593F
MLVLAMLLAMPPLALAAAAPRIGVMTMQPGEVFFERFGHDAIVVVDPDSGEAVSYNFGFFDPSEPDFLSRFIRGEMMYHLVALPATQDLAQYQAAGRGVSMQWLDLEPEQARALAALLAERARPENSRYRYDYFTANCATQVRDALDTAMGGALKAQLAGRSRGNTYRSEAVRLASPAPWMWLGFDLGLGPYADRALSRWEEAFVPMRLADSLREARNRQGRPLVQSEQELLPHLIAPEPVEAPRRWWPWLLAGLSLATAIFAARRRPRLLAGFALPLWLLCGLAGALLVFLWGFTAHQAGWANRNLFLLSPLCLLLLPGAIALLRRRVPGRLFRPLLWAVAAIAMLGWILQWLSLQPQYNLSWIALLLPVHVALALALGRRSR